MKSKGILLPALTWFAILSAVGTLLHIDLIDSLNYPDQQELHSAIVHHSASAPYQYRVLQPALVEALLKASRTEANTTTYRRFFMGGYAGIRFLAIFTTLSAVFFSLRLTWTEGTAALASTALAAFLPFTYRYYYYQPTSILEMAFFGLGLVAVQTRTPSALFPLVAVGTLNRETMCFLPFTYFLYWLPKLRKKDWLWLVIAAATWLLVFAGLRIVWPATHNLLNISKSVSSNLRFFRGNLDLLVILAPSILLLFRARELPPPYWRIALCSVPWLILHFFTSNWYEIRYYMPVLIWLLPGLVFVFSGEGTARKSDETVSETGVS
jgi:hypothetical protein